jgi:hypothetical protein
MTIAQKLGVSLVPDIHNRTTAVVLGLLGLAAVHVMDLPGKWTETPYLAFAYIGIIAVTVILVESLIKKPTAVAFAASFGLALAVIFGYVINRTVGMPGSMGDIGNWFEPLGLLSLGVEAFLAWNAFAAFRALREAQKA